MQGLLLSHHHLPFHMYADYLRPDHIATSKAWTVKSSVVKTAGLESSTSSSVLREVIAEWLNHHDPKTEIATDLMLALKRVHSAPSNIPVPTLTPILVLLSGTSISFTTICQPFTFTASFIPEARQTSTVIQGFEKVLKGFRCLQAGICLAS